MVLTQHRHTLLILFCVGRTNDVMSRLEKKRVNDSVAPENYWEMSHLCPPTDIVLCRIHFEFICECCCGAGSGTTVKMNFPKTSRRGNSFLLLVKKWIKCKLSKILFSFFHSSAAAVLLFNSLIFFYFFLSQSTKLGTEVWRRYMGVWPTIH